MNTIDIILIISIIAVSTWYFYPKPKVVYKHVIKKVVKKSFIDSILASQASNFLVLFFASQTGTAQGTTHSVLFIY